MSRGIVREAYRSLRAACIIETANGRRPRVSRIAPFVLTRWLTHARDTRQISAEQVREFWMPFELLAVELAAARRTDRDVAALRRQLSSIEAAADTNGRALVRALVRFEDAVGRATGNPLVGMVARALRRSAAPSLPRAADGSDARSAHVVSLYRRLVDAIERRQSARARRLMARHFETLRSLEARQSLSDRKTRLGAHI